MPVFKYRSIEETPSDHWLEPGDPRIGRRLRHVCELASALAGPLRVAPGLYKYHSAEELYAEKERWQRERIDRIRSQREGT